VRVGGVYLVAGDEEVDEVAHYGSFFVVSAEREAGEDGTSGRVVDVVELLEHVGDGIFGLWKRDGLLLGFLWLLVNASRLAKARHLQRTFHRRLR
jgi:hypothetical protein